MAASATSRPDSAARDGGERPLQCAIQGTLSDGSAVLSGSQMAFGELRGHAAWSLPSSKSQCRQLALSEARSKVTLNSLGRGQGVPLNLRRFLPSRASAWPEPPSPEPAHGCRAVATERGKGGARPARSRVAVGATTVAMNAMELRLPRACRTAEANNAPREQREYAFGTATAACRKMGGTRRVCCNAVTPASY
jgi:hypothetical protein